MWGGKQRAFRTFGNIRTCQAIRGRVENSRCARGRNAGRGSSCSGSSGRLKRDRRLTGCAMKDEQKIRVLVADDHFIVRIGLLSVINTEPDMHVVGEAADGSQAVEQFLKTNPDLV